MSVFIKYTPLYLMLSCGNVEQDRSGYHIQIEVASPNTNTLYLAVLPPVSRRTPDDYDRNMIQKQIIDSAQLTNGKYTFNSKEDLPYSRVAGLCYRMNKTYKYAAIKYKNNSTNSFVIDNGEYTFRGPTIEELNINGSKEQQLYEAYMNKELGMKYETFVNILKNHSSSDVALTWLWNNKNKFDHNELVHLLSYASDSYKKKSLLYADLQQYTKYTNTPLVMNEVLPDFVLKDSSKRVFRLSNFKDKSKLIVFWSSGCIPCRNEIPDLKLLYQKYNKADFEIISISTDYNDIYWKKALNEENMSWTNLISENVEDLYSKYQFNAIPLMYFVDKNNKIIASKVYDFQTIKKAVDNFMSDN